jgi:small neutral amino acid transporter SnatA (MarC family)
VGILSFIGILMLCWAVGHIALPVASRFTRRVPRYRLTRNGKIIDLLLALVGIIAIAVGYREN